MFGLVVVQSLDSREELNNEARGIERFPGGSKWYLEASNII